MLRCLPHTSSTPSSVASSTSTSKPARECAPSFGVGTRHHQCVRALKRIDVPSNAAGFVRTSTSGTTRPVSTRAGNNVDDMNVDNLPDYCTDFVCTSSPAVELTVKALAKDIERGNGVWTKSLLSKTIEYKDAYCSTKGIDSFKVDFIPTFCKATSIKVNKLYMVDASPSRQAVVEYTVEGMLNPDKDGGTAVTVDMKTRVTMNLLTGQIETREDSWSVRSLLSKPSWNAARLAWAGVQKSREARKKGSELIEKSVSGVLGSLDAEEDGFQPDPNDPTKWFSSNDSFKDDAVTFTIFLLILYIVVQGYTTLFGGGGGGVGGVGGGFGGF